MKNFSKITVFILVLTSLNACKKDDSAVTPTTPVTTGCKISKIDYGGGEYDAYTFNSSGQVSQYDSYAKDASGKIAHTIITFMYDSNGLLSNSKFDGGQEKYAYANGALTAIEVFDDKNVSIYKITVTTDANKRIIGMKDSNNYSNKITRDALGNFNKSETFDEKNNLLVREEVSKYDGKKNWRSALSGWPLDVSIYYGSYIYYGGYFNEPSGSLDDDKIFWAYDDKGNYTGKLVLINDLTYTKQFNSKGFPAKVVSKDAVNPNDNLIRTYTYSDCQ